MKKVRYAIGTAGAVPTALGLTMPPAMAATALSAHSANPVTKVVSLRHGTMRPATSCAGHNFHSKHNASAVLRFWSTPEGTDKTCIGTVQGYDNNGGTYKYRVRIYQSISTHKTKVYSTGSKAGHSFNLAVRQSYDNKIQICVKYFWSFGTGPGSSIMCSSVG